MAAKFRVRRSEWT